MYLDEHIKINQIGDQRDSSGNSTTWPKNKTSDLLPNITWSLYSKQVPEAPK